MIRAYCPRCKQVIDIQPKYQWYVVVTGDIPQSYIYGPFNNQPDAETWAKNFLDPKYKQDWQALEVTPPDL